MKSEFYVKLKKMKPKEFQKLNIQEALVNLWLQEFFNKTLDVESANSELYKMEDGQFTAESTRTFYSLHKVTKEQHDLWEFTAKNLIKEKLKWPNYILKRNWLYIYLNTAPSC